MWRDEPSFCRCSSSLALAASVQICKSPFLKIKIFPAVDVFLLRSANEDGWMQPCQCLLPIICSRNLHPQHSHAINPILVCLCFAAMSFPCLPLKTLIWNDFYSLTMKFLVQIHILNVHACRGEWLFRAAHHSCIFGGGPVTRGANSILPDETSRHTSTIV